MLSAAFKSFLTTRHHEKQLATTAPSPLSHFHANGGESIPIEDMYTRRCTLSACMAETTLRMLCAALPRPRCSSLPGWRLVGHAITASVPRRALRSGSAASASAYGTSNTCGRECSSWSSVKNDTGFHFSLSILPTTSFALAIARTVMSGSFKACATACCPQSPRPPCDSRTARTGIPDVYAAGCICK